MEDQEFKTYARSIIEDAGRRGAQLRLLGAVAFSLHCPQFGHLQNNAGRHFTDLDFAGYFKQSDLVRKTLESMGFEEEREAAVVYARSRLIYNHPASGLHVDVFLEKLDFCHPIPWAGRLEKDSPTIPLAELLLEKMQIVKINEKDVIDTIMLTREHPLGSQDTEEINAPYISGMCAADWGLWRTVTMNLSKVIELAQGYAWLAPEDRQVVTSRIQDLLGRIEAAPKSFGWKTRSKIGDRVKWYKEIDEVIQ